MDAVLKIQDSSGSTVAEAEHPVKLQLQLGFWLAAPGLRFCAPSPEASDPCCGTMVEVRPESVLCSIDNSDSGLEVYFIAASSLADLFQGTPVQLVGKLGAVESPGVSVLISVPKSRSISASGWQCFMKASSQTPPWLRRPQIPYGPCCIAWSWQAVSGPGST